MYLRLMCIGGGAVFLFFLFFLLSGSVQAAPETKESPTLELPETAPQAVLTSSVAAAFAEKHLRFGAPVFLRVYKQSSEVELWVQQGPRYALFKTYSICRWSGGLGPKMVQGDRQAPEGLYHITAPDLVVNRRWHRAMRLNYPNAFDVVNGRTGYGIYIHGKCRSVGCFAINDDNVEEVYEIVRAALSNGQVRIPVLSLPFRFSSINSLVNEPFVFGEFWRELRRADFLFNRDRLPPSASLCDGNYYFSGRRGDWRGRYVRLPRGCRPLEKPISPEEAAAFASRLKLLPLISVAPGLSPKEATEKAARSCNPRDLRCRLLRVALASNVICPKKYPRCRTSQAVFTKSFECPLKYPRCRWFVGPDPRKSRAVNAATKRVKR
jgi:murein L,D-transpeptidase YafK